MEDEYQRFIQIYQEIIIRLEKLESLLSDAERVVDLTRISVGKKNSRETIENERFFLFSASSRGITKCSNTTR